MSGHGEMDNLIIECLTEAIQPRWRRWLEQEVKKDQKSSGQNARKA